MRISDWSSDVCSSDLVQVRGTTASPRLSGTLEVVRGTYSFASKRFDVDHGIVRFEGGEWTNPQIDIAATTEQEDINATIAITGSAQDPHIAFTSTPALPQDEVLSRSEEHTSELQSLMRNSYAVFCLKKKKLKTTHILT